jgi:hypothetical protein
MLTFQCIWDCLFGNLVAYDRQTHDRHELPWRILKETERQKMTKYLSRACAAWAKASQITPVILHRFVRTFRI